MRKLIYSGVALAALSAAFVAPTPASAQNAPWCIAGDGENSQFCGFSSFNQCKASLSGRSGSCIANPELAYRRGPAYESYAYDAPPIYSGPRYIERDYYPAYRPYYGGPYYGGPSVQFGVGVW